MPSRRAFARWSCVRSVELGADTTTDLTDPGTGQQVKTSASVRSIPIHPELARLGFLEYAEAMQEAREASLWPHPKLRKGRPRGLSFGLVGDFRKAAGLTEQYPDFHCFRHTVRTLMSRAGVDYKVQDCIQATRREAAPEPRCISTPTRRS